MFIYKQAKSRIINIQYAMKLEFVSTARMKRFLVPFIRITMYDGGAGVGLFWSDKPSSAFY
jgi:hypothetical protein